MDKANKIFPGQDASILAIIAQAPNMPQDNFDELFSEISCQEMKEVALAIVGRSENIEALKSAKAFREWAEGNRAP